MLRPINVARGLTAHRTLSCSVFYRSAKSNKRCEKSVTQHALAFTFFIPSTLSVASRAFFFSLRFVLRASARALAAVIWSSEGGGFAFRTLGARGPFPEVAFPEVVSSCSVFSPSRLPFTVAVFTVFDVIARSSFSEGTSACIPFSSAKELSIASVTGSVDVGGGDGGEGVVSATVLSATVSTFASRDSVVHCPFSEGASEWITASIFVLSTIAVIFTICERGSDGDEAMLADVVLCATTVVGAFTDRLFTVRSPFPEGASRCSMPFLTVVSTTAVFFTVSGKGGDGDEDNSDIVVSTIIVPFSGKRFTVTPPFSEGTSACTVISPPVFKLSRSALSTVAAIVAVRAGDGDEVLFWSTNFPAIGTTFTVVEEGGDGCGGEILAGDVDFGDVGVAGAACGREVAAGAGVTGTACRREFGATHGAGDEETLTGGVEITGVRLAAEAACRRGKVVAVGVAEALRRRGGAANGVEEARDVTPANVGIAAGGVC